MSLRRRLAVLIAVAMTPPFLLTVYNTVRWQLFLEKDAREEVLTAARLVSAEVEQLLTGSRQLMWAMSRHPAVPDNETECSAYFRSVIAGFPIYRQAAVIDPDARFHCSTIEIPPTLDVRDRVYFAEAMQTDRFTIGTLVRGRVTGQTSIHLSLPFTRADGAPGGVVALVLNPDIMAQDLAARPWRTHHRILVLDRDGAVVATVPQEQVEDAGAIARNLKPQLASKQPGIVDVQGLEGREEIVGFVPVKPSQPGLFVAVSIDRELALEEVRYTNTRSIAFGLITLLLAAGGVWGATYFLINRPVRAIVNIARRREAGDTTARFPRLRFSTEFDQLSSALSRMSNKIDELLGQKSLLLRELQHRVMNSLNLLSSVLELQSRDTKHAGTRQHLARARDRIVAMGTVYRYLYQADTSDRVEFSGLLRTICEESQNAYVGARQLAIEVEAEPLQLSGSHAIALGMCTHELITNAIKHAFAEGEPGPIRVSLKRNSDATFEFRFADSGRGLPEDFDIETSSSLGMKMILSTARQLGGSLEINNLQPGTEFVIYIPAQAGNGGRA
jgi:two-component sensor histidine kinase